MNRRQFFSRVLAPVAAAVVVPELARTIFLPPRGGWPVDLSRYLTSKTAWFIKEPPAELMTFMRSRNPGLTEDSLEQALFELTFHGRTRFSIKPTHLIVHPSWTPEQVEERLARLL